MTPLDQVLSDTQDALERGVFAKLTLGAPTSGATQDLQKLVARPVELRAGPRIQLVYRHATRDVTRNLPAEEAFATFRELVPEVFRAVHLHTTEKSVQLDWRGERFHRSEGPAAHSAPASVTHDRAKRRVLEPDHRWTTALGITGSDGRPKRGMVDKHRQILRFLEVLDHWLGDAPRPEDGRTRWIDMGCGSGALTFATWEYLRRTGYGAAEVTGIELRPELAAKTERTARALGCDGLSFVAGRIGDQELGPVDGVIALHACDTATDDALAAGIGSGARWLLAAPCCHKELRPRLAPPSAMAVALRHGILRTREAEIATDALRAALLEAAGYDARVFEFVSTEHTDKNLMIAAVRRAAALPGATETARDLATHYGITRQRLADRLGLALSPAPDPEPSAGGQP